MSDYYIPGGVVSLLPGGPRKDGKGTFPASMKIATPRGYLMLSPEQVRGLLEIIANNQELSRFVANGQ